MKKILILILCLIFLSSCCAGLRRNEKKTRSRIIGAQAQLRYVSSDQHRQKINYKISKLHGKLATIRARMAQGRCR